MMGDPPDSVVFEYVNFDTPSPPSVIPPESPPPLPSSSTNFASVLVPNDNEDEEKLNEVSYFHDALN